MFFRKALIVALFATVAAQSVARAECGDNAKILGAMGAGSGAVVGAAAKNSLAGMAGGGIIGAIIGGIFGCAVDNAQTTEQKVQKASQKCMDGHTDYCQGKIDYVTYSIKQVTEQTCVCEIVTSVDLRTGYTVQNKLCGKQLATGFVYDRYETERYADGKAVYRQGDFSITYEVRARQRNADGIRRAEEYLARHSGGYEQGNNNGGNSDRSSNEISYDEYNKLYGSRNKEARRSGNDDGARSGASNQTIYGCWKSPALATAKYLYLDIGTCQYFESRQLCENRGGGYSEKCVNVTTNRDNNSAPASVNQPVMRAN